MRRKVYGQSRSDVCPFCSKRATTSNEQGIPVCITHKNAIFPDLKCVCGEYLDLKSGKFGPYFNCISCGNLSWNKIMELHPNIEFGKKKEEPAKTPTQTKSRPRYNVVKKDKKEITITSDELDFL